MTDKQTEILEKIRKLNAHAESAAEIGNEAEAQAFAAKVQQLLTDYKLSVADISGNARADEAVNITYITWQDMGLTPRHARVGWTERLATLCARTYYCEFLISTGFGRIGMLVGTETDRKVCSFMFITLGRFLTKLADREMDIYWKRVVIDAGLKSLPPGCNNFKAGFIAGFLDRLRERFDEEIRPKADLSAQAKTNAIVLVRKNALDKTRVWIKDNVKTHSVRKSHMNDGSSDGRARGRDAANDLNLHPNPIGNTGRERNQLR